MSKLLLLDQSLKYDGPLEIFYLFIISKPLAYLVLCNITEFNLNTHFYEVYSNKFVNPIFIRKLVYFRHSYYFGSWRFLHSAKKSYSVMKHYQKKSLQSCCLLQFWQDYQFDFYGGELRIFNHCVNNILFLFWKLRLSSWLLRLPRIFTDFLPRNYPQAVPYPAFSNNWTYYWIKICQIPSAHMYLSVLE